GVRLLRTNLTETEVRPKLDRLLADLFANVPSGLGSQGKIRLKGSQIDKLLLKGAAWALAEGYGEPNDLEYIEEQGFLKGANPDEVSARAKTRGTPQSGTLGSGNHFLEIQVVDEIYDTDTARAFGIEDRGQILIHTGSRGLGHQVCDDYLKTMNSAVRSYGIELPDRQLACAPVKSPEGQSYLAAMACAANYAWANRQCITHWTRESFSKVLGKRQRDLNMAIVYDVAHNIAKIEKHQVSGKKLSVCVHRKGATRAFPSGHPEIPEAYRRVGQPVLIPGDMGRYSYIAVGTERAMEETFGSTCHGAGRLKSRSAAKRSISGADVARELANKGITVKAASIASLAEEAPAVYKDVADVVHITDAAGISLKVVRARPIGVIKG
ncbi:RtcB family protein, partial [Chloroflexota bacterium]